jgi:hypothetical protein
LFEEDGINATNKKESNAIPQIQKIPKKKALQLTRLKSDKNLRKFIIWTPKMPVNLTNTFVS